MREDRIIYTKILPSVVKRQRRFFQDHVKKAFVKWCAYNHLLDSCLSDSELRAAKKGTLPKDLNVHHIVPLSASSSSVVNTFNNLCIIHVNTHTRINKEYFQRQLEGMYKEDYGTQRTIVVPVFDYVDAVGIIEERKKCLTSRNKSGIIPLKGWQR